MEGIKKWAVYTIRSRAGLGKPIWVKIGIAFMNRDGSVNLHLDATPLDGKLQMREWRDEASPSTNMHGVSPNGTHTNGAVEVATDGAELPF